LILQSPRLNRLSIIFSVLDMKCEVGHAKAREQGADTGLNANVLMCQTFKLQARRLCHVVLAVNMRTCTLCKGLVSLKLEAPDQSVPVIPVTGVRVWAG